MNDVVTPLIGNITIIKNTDQSDSSIPIETATCCPECGWKGPVGDWDIYEDSEGWEYPSFTVLACPKCGKDVDI